MLKVLIVAEGSNAKDLQTKFATMNNMQVIDNISIQNLVNSPESYIQADFIAMSTDAMSVFLKALPNNARTHVKAVTHQGIKLVPLEDILYFQAEHKYVTVVHKNGQLLIEDSLNSLENEFADTFIRIHRKTLVAKNQILTLEKDSNGQHVVKLKDIKELLAVSRRQLPNLRKVLLCL